jgi:hypothetical protein
MLQSNLNRITKLNFVFVIGIMFFGNLNIAFSQKEDSINIRPLAAFRLDSVWYFIDIDGRQFLPPKKLKSVESYKEGFIHATLEYDGKIRNAFITLDDKVAIPDCDEIKPLSEDMAIIINYIDVENQIYLFGFINGKGQIIVKPQYLEALDFSEGLAWVMNKEKRGYINKKGNLVIDYKGNGFGNSFHQGLAGISKEDSTYVLFGFINKKGEIVIDFKYDDVGNFTEDFCKVNLYGLFGFIDTTGKLRIKHAYDFANDFSESYAFVGIPDTANQSPIWGILDKNGNMTVDFKFREIKDFSEGMATVKLDDKWFFIDPQGKKIIDKSFDYADSFKNSLAWIADKTDNKYGFINPNGEMVYEIPEKADFVVDLRWNRKVK